MVACGKSSGKKKDDDKAKNEAANNSADDMAVGTAAGTSRETDRSNPEIDYVMWEVTWERANLMKLDGHNSGEMLKVKGSAFVKPTKKGEPELVASTFAADRAVADDKEKRLVIEGNVRVESKSDPKAVMTAKKVEWLPRLQVYKASGDVLIDGERGVVGPISELYTDAELKQFATSKDYIKIEKSVKPKGPFK